MKDLRVAGVAGPRGAALLAALVVAAACSKTEPASSKPRPNAPLQAPAATADKASSSGESVEALKERLARQEAAAMRFDMKAVPESKAPRPAEPPAKAPERATPASTPAKPDAAPAKAAAPATPTGAPAPASAAPAASPPPVVPAPVTSTTPAATPSSVPPKAAPASPPPTVAAARPAPAPALAAPKLRTRTDLVFPREAMQAGIDAGLVKARMTLDGAGNVTRVDVVDANPRRVFDRAVVRSLSEWKYDEGASGRTVTVELEFRR